MVLDCTEVCKHPNQGLCVTPGAMCYPFWQAKVGSQVLQDGGMVRVRTSVYLCAVTTIGFGAITYAY